VEHPVLLKSLTDQHSSLFTDLAAHDDVTLVEAEVLEEGVGHGRRRHQDDQGCLLEHFRGETEKKL
jgi:hypothetical protein